MDDTPCIIIEDKVEEGSNLARIANYEIPDRDNFKCPSHPGYKIEALYMNNDTLCFCCVKCFIEDAGLTRKYKILPLKDLFAACVEVPSSVIRIDVEEEEIEGTLTEIMVKDYGKQYQHYYEFQQNVVTSEIDQLIEGLKKLKEKYSNQIMIRKGEMETMEEEIKRRIAYSNNKMQEEQRKYRSLNEIYTKLAKLHTKEETLNFFKDIYDVRMNEVGAQRKEKSVKRMADEFKEKVRKLEDQEVDVSNLKEMKQKVGVLLQAESFPLKRSGPLRDLSNVLDIIELTIPEARKPSKTPRKVAPASIDFEEDSYFEDEYYPKLKKRKDSKNLKISPSTQYSTPDKIIRENELKLSLNKRITGYLVFKHTIMEKFRGSAQELNHIVGEKWRNLTREEKGSYDDFARMKRKMISNEIKEVMQREDGLSDSLETLKMNIKKIKKE